MVGGTTPPQSDSREISRVLVLNLSGKASGAHAPPRRGLSLTTPSLLSRGTLESRSVLKFSIILRLGQTEPIAERILKDCFHAVELILRFGDEFHAFGLQFFKGHAAIGGVEGCHPAGPQPGIRRRNKIADQCRPERQSFPIRLLMIVPG